MMQDKMNFVYYFWIFENTKEKGKSVTVTALAILKEVFLRSTKSFHKTVEMVEKVTA
jgi:hypothetical protein